MGILCAFRIVGDDTIDSLLGEPASIHALLGSEEEEGYGLDLDKAWHCLHFLLTGCAEGGAPPLDFILAGGTQVGSEDVGLGPARAFTSSEVAGIAAALRPLGHYDMVRRFDARRMAELEIYPFHDGEWLEVDLGDLSSFVYYLGTFGEVKALVEHAETRGLGLLVWFC